MILQKLISNPKRLFLIDCLGALLTALFLLTILARFESIFGMPVSVLYFLSLIAGIFAIYSFCCFYFFPDNLRPFLRIILIANLLYCCLTAGFIISFYNRLTILGWIYFVMEIMIIICLSVIEFRTLKSKSS